MGHCPAPGTRMVYHAALGGGRSRLDQEEIESTHWPAEGSCRPRSSGTAATRRGRAPRRSATARALIGRRRTLRAWRVSESASSTTECTSPQTEAGYTATALLSVSTAGRALSTPTASGTRTYRLSV